MTQKLATAEWADPDQFAEKNAYSTGRFWLGRSPVNGQPLGYDDDRHVCLVSGSRSGKGTTTIIPNLCLWPGSVVVVDPKGENATITAARRGPGSEHCKGLGQKVHVLDPFGVAKVDDALRSRFNPLDAIDPTSSRAIDEAGSLADAIVVISPDAKEPFWDESARSLIKTLILHVLTSPLFKGKRNLVTVRQLITRGDHEGVEILRRKGKDKLPTGQELLWYGVSKNEHYNGVIAGFGQSMRDMLKSSPKQFNSVVQIANRNTEFLDSPDMQRCVEASDFQLTDLKTDPKGVSVFLSLPPQYMGEHFRWLRMMVTLTVFQMQAHSSQPVSGHRVLMCLDEFAGLEYMKIIETAVAQIAGFGVKLFFVLQSLEQLKATYKDAWQTFLSNAGMSIYFGIGDNFTREHVSEMIGDTELIRELATATETTNEQTTTTAGTTSSKSWNTQETVGASEGRSTSDNWKSMPMGLKFTAGFIAAITGNRSASKNKNTSTSTGTATSDGGSQAEQESTATAAGQSSATGRNETLQKRRLVTPDEVARFFGRIDDKDDPIYPGLGLTVHVNSTPSPVQRVNYFEDAFFENKFDPHPDHGMPPPPKASSYNPAPDEMLMWLTRGASIGVMPQVKEGDYIKAGDLFLKLDSAKEIVPIAFRSPYTGTVRKCSYEGGRGVDLVVETRQPADLSVVNTDIDRLEAFIRDNQEGLQEAMDEGLKECMQLIGAGTAFLVFSVAVMLLTIFATSGILFWVLLVASVIGTLIGLLLSGIGIAAYVDDLKFSRSEAAPRNSNRLDTVRRMRQDASRLIK